MRPTHVRVHNELAPAAMEDPCPQLMPQSAWAPAPHTLHNLAPMAGHMASQSLQCPPFLPPALRPQRAWCWTLQEPVALASWQALLGYTHGHCKWGRLHGTSAAILMHGSTVQSQAHGFWSRPLLAKVRNPAPYCPGNYPCLTTSFQPGIAPWRSGLKGPRERVRDLGTTSSHQHQQCPPGPTTGSGRVLGLWTPQEPCVNEQPWGQAAPRHPMT